MPPSDFSEDTPATASRLAALEAAYERIISDNAATQQLLLTLMKRSDPSVPVTPPTISSLPPTILTPPKRTVVKPSSPCDFDGERSKGRAFLTSCRTYIRLCPDSFPDEPTKIMWALSYMNSGRANRWAGRELEFEARIGGGHFRFIDWQDFEEEFRKDFFPLNAASTAINTLETTSYFQGRDTVDNYLDRFKDIIHDSGYTDPKTVVVKFRRGLDRQLAAMIAGMTIGRPADDDPNGWYNLATQLDQNRAADEAFYASQRTVPTSHRSAPPLRVAPLNPQMRAPLQPSTAPTAKTSPDTCRRCKNIGHWAKECPMRFDVRYMEADEIEEALETKNAARDAVPTAPNVDTEVLPPCSIEDFLPLSG
jgi:Retrotransposon gag protein/Zinc knuckle